MYPSQHAINTFLLGVEAYEFTVVGSRFTNSLLVAHNSNLNVLRQDSSFSSLCAVTRKYIASVTEETHSIRRYLRIQDFFLFFSQDDVSDIIYAHEEETWLYLQRFYDFIIRIEQEANEGKVNSAAFLTEWSLQHFCDVHPFFYVVDDEDVDY